MVSDDAVTTKIDGFLQGFDQQGAPRYMSDGSVEVTMEIPLDGFAQAVLPASVSDIPPVKKGLKPTKKKPSFTGLIVDCSGLGLKPAMLPAVYDETNKEVFGGSTVGRSFAAKWGVAAYAGKVDEAKSLVDRIGTNPLVIKALKVVGQGSTDALISKKSGAAVSGNPANYGILEECRVVFVVE
jgi:hypothetical protein